VHAEAAVAQAQLQLALVEDGAVLIPEDGQQDLAAQLLLHRMPVDVEEGGVLGHGPLLQHVQPPRVVVARDAHVVGHHVEEQSHAARAQARRQPLQRGLAADLLAHAVVIGDVVAVRVLRGGL
jgi:hypothetical protein